MIIHSPKITGSLAFPREDGTEVVLQISTGGELETIEKDTSGNQTSNKPSTNLSGSFTGSFLGDGSNLTGVAATSLNIDGFSAGTLAGDDEILFSDTSDSGNEKRATFVSGIDAIGLFSGSSQLTSSFDLRYLEINGDNVVSGSQQILDLVSIDEDNFASNSNTKVPTQQSVKAYVDAQVDTADALSELSGDSDDITEGSTNFFFTNERVDDRVNALITGGTGISTTYDDAAGTLTINGSAQYGDSDVTDHLDSLSVISGSASQVRTLLNVENGADVTDAGNVVPILDANTVVSGSIQIDVTSTTNYVAPAITDNSGTPTLVSGITAAEVRSTIGVDPSGTDNSTDVTLSNTNYLSLSGQQLTGGTVPIGSGGTGATSAAAARTALGVDASGTDNSTDVTLGNTNYLSISGQEITGGTVPIGSGGTGATSAAAARTALGVDASGTDNSTDVTLVGSYDYITISGQVITRNQITNDDLAGSIANSKLVNSSISIDGTDVSLGGSVTTLQLGTSSTTALAGDTTTITSGQASAITANSSKVGYTDALVKTKLDAEAVLSGSITSANITDVDAFSQSGNYSSLRAQATTATDVGLGNVTNESKGTMFASPTFTGTVAGVTAAHVGLGNVTNESKSTMFASPAFTGNPTAPTQTSTNDSTRLATTAFVQTRVSELIGNAGSTLDTLGELSASLADDQDSLSSLTTTVGTKLAKSSNLSDLADAGTARTNLGLGSVENTALSTYTGQGGALDNQYITNGAGYITSFTNTNQLTTFQVEDGDGTEVTISHGKEWKFVEGTGIDINWTDTSNGTDGDPYDLTITNTAPFTGDVFDNSGNYTGLRAQATTATDVGLGNVTNESKGTMFASPTFTGTVSGVTAAHVGLGNVTNESKGTMFASPTFTGTVAGVTKSHVGLGNVENTALSTYTGDGGALDNQYITNGAGYISSFDITTQTDSKYLRSNANDTATGIITLSNSTASTNKTTGALIVTGGVGISGALNVGGDVVAYASSDERLKDNIELISNPIEKVQSLKGVTWNWNENADELQQSLPNVGVIAQDVEKILPQLVTDRDNGFKGVDYAKLTGLLIEAIKEQQKQIDELKSKIG